jgi:hypothetical protein
MRSTRSAHVILLNVIDVIMLGEVWSSSPCPHAPCRTGGDAIACAVQRVPGCTQTALTVSKLTALATRRMDGAEVKGDASSTVTLY